MSLKIYNNYFDGLEIFVIVLLIFLLGILFTLITPKFIKLKVTGINLLLIRLLKHMWSMIPILIILLIIYILLDMLLDYGQAIGPELVGAGISVVVLDFLFKERQLNGRKNIDKLLNNKLDKVYKLIDNFLLKYIDLQNINNAHITRELINDILTKEDLNTSKIKYERITNDGKYEELEISKFDFLYYFGDELLPIVENLISKYENHLDDDCICDLIKIEEILNKKIFKIRLSTIGTIYGEEYNIYKGVIIEALISLKDISYKQNHRGNYYGD